MEKEVAEAMEEVAAHTVAREVMDKGVAAEEA